MHRLDEQLRGATLKSLLTTALIVILMLLSLGICGYLITVFFLDRLDSFAEYLHEELPWSIPIYFVIFTLCMMVMLPAGPFAVALGYAYGLKIGFLIHTCALMFAANVIFFFFGNYCRNWMETQVRRFPKLGAIKHLVKGSGGFRIALLSCQAPIPFGLFVGFFSISGINAMSFFFALLIGSVPMTLISLEVGTAAATSAYGGYESGSKEMSSSTFDGIAFAVAGIGTVALVLYVIWYGSAAIEEIDATNGGEAGRLLRRNVRNFGDNNDSVSNNDSNSIDFEIGGAQSVHHQENGGIFPLATMSTTTTTETNFGTMQ